MNVFEFFYRAFKKIRFLLYKIVTKILGRILFSLNGVEYQNGLTVNGLLELTVTRNGKFAVGENLKINSGSKFNPIGRQQRT